MSFRTFASGSPTSPELCCFALCGKEVTASVETYLAHHGEWRELMTFTLAGQGIAYPDRYRAYTNQRELIPEGWPALAAEGAAKLLAVMQGDETHGSASAPGSNN